MLDDRGKVRFAPLPGFTSRAWMHGDQEFSVPDAALLQQCSGVLVFLRGQA
jgi:hypothetical protein